uniref:Uncharacterized protein n=1 Tax=Oryza glumipatula TaxID=40148 RepID=A0A0D9YVV6_9ORYZ
MRLTRGMGTSRRFVGAQEVTHLATKAPTPSITAVRFVLLRAGRHHPPSVAIISLNDSPGLADTGSLAGLMLAALPTQYPCKSIQLQQHQPTRMLCRRTGLGLCALGSVVAAFARK